MNKLCCFCKMPVLGIFGQDDLLDSYNLQREEEDQRAVAEGAFGSCHIKCLLNSPWNDFWVKRRLANFMDPRGYKLIYEEEDGRIFRDHRTGGNIVVLASGVLLPLADRTIKSGLSAEGTAVRIVQPERFWEVAPPLKGARAEDLFDENGHIPLLRLAESLGVLDKFHDLGQAQRARLQAIEGRTAARLEKGILLATVLISVSLPHRLLSQLGATVASPSLPTFQ
jgi:hypothetical protein